MLFPAAAEVDARGVIPPSHFTALAEAGLYGIAASDDARGAARRHRGARRSLPGHDVHLDAAPRAGAGVRRHCGTARQAYLAAATAGALRCGVALAGALPDPPRLWATRVADGYRLDGEAPLVTGWGLVDLVQVAARDVDDRERPRRATR